MFIHDIELQTLHVITYLIYNNLLIAMFIIKYIW